MVKCKTLIFVLMTCWFLLNSCNKSKTIAHNDTNIIQENRYAATTLSAVIIGSSILEIKDKNGHLVLRYSWDEAQSRYPNADTIYDLGWDDSNKNYWFWSITPTHISYIAKYNVDKKELCYFDAPDDICGYNEYCFDTNKAILIYSNWFNPQSPEDEKEILSSQIILKKYNVEQKKISIIETNIGNKYSPVLENGLIKNHVREEIKILSE